MLWELMLQAFLQIICLIDLVWLQFELDLNRSLSCSPGTWRGRCCSPSCSTWSTSTCMWLRPMASTFCGATVSLRTTQVGSWPSNSLQHRAFCFYLQHALLHIWCVLSRWVVEMEEFQPHPSPGFGGHCHLCNRIVLWALYCHGNPRTLLNMIFFVFLFIYIYFLNPLWGCVV